MQEPGVEGDREGGHALPTSVTHALLEGAQCVEGGLEGDMADLYVLGVLGQLGHNEGVGSV